MVGSWSRRFVSGIALGCAMLAVLPIASPAQGTESPQYTTAITTVYGSQYPLTGRLDLQIFPDGHLRGYYHTSYYKLFIPVVGGRDGNYIWFDIGPSSIDLGLGAGPEGKLHIVATMNNDGSFRGQVYPETAAVLSGLAMQYQFASPAPLSETSNDQYIFSATPAAQPEPTPSP
ncbi:MAG TPA: hypothetical protein VFF63_00120 [Candidatus Babeliales bacterium]|nr:hypothetical protein [Candidatus Babeliales bacterium]